MARLLAPYVPFTAEALWQRLVVPVEPSAPDSVHLADWPAVQGVCDEALAEDMAEVRRLVGLGRQARTDAKVRVRQPLAEALVSVPMARRAGVERLAGVIAAELNVKEVRFSRGEHGLVGHTLKPAFRTLGPRFGKKTPAVAEAVRAAAGDTLGPRLAAGESVRLEVSGVGEVELHPDEVEVLEQPITGWTVANDETSSVALDLTVTAELRREGLARELIRLVQDLRKTARLAVEDRIDLAVTAGGEVAEAQAAHRDYLLSETLAVSLHAAPQEEGHEAVHELDGEEVRLWLSRVGDS